MAVNVSDQSAQASQSGGTFIPTFGSIGLPENKEVQVVVIAVAVVVGLIIWKKL